MDFQILNLIFRCSREFNHNKMRTQNINDSEGMICLFISNNPDCSQDDVADALKMDKTTVAKAILVLECKGLIKRKKDPSDKRKKKLRLTEEGREKMDYLAQVHQKWVSEMLSVLSEEEQKQFKDYFLRILNAAQKQISAE